MDLGQPVGTTIAHGRLWPMFERQAYIVRVQGQVDMGNYNEAKVLEQELRQLLEPHGLTVTLEPVTVLFMTPEDQAEKERLDLQSLN